MKIVLDTVTKQAVCPPEFFESIRKINDASELTESSKKVTSEDYLQIANVVIEPITEE